MKRAIFPGTFDPFTVGHDSITRRALELFDEVIVAVGINVRKTTMFSLEERIKAVRDLYRDEPRVRVVSFDDLTVDLAEREGAQFIVRGIRSSVDFEYEKTIADINKELSGIETVFLLTEAEYSTVSSTMVRELITFGRDVSKYMP